MPSKLKSLKGHMAIEISIASFFLICLQLPSSLQCCGTKRFQDCSK